jgi:DNA-binding NarL/FixJ family response regulator
MITVYKNIILADDDADDRDLFTEAVNFIDPTINVIAQRDGEQLMNYLDANLVHFDLIFLDLNMPRKNGKECLRELKTVQRRANMPVVIYTTSLNPVDIEETYALGADLFLRKPNSFEELKATLTAVLRGQMDVHHRSRERFVVNKVINVL